MSSDSPKHSPRSVWPKLFLIMVLVLLVLIVGVFIYDAIGQAQLNQALEEACQDRGPVTFEELQAARKVWPDEENGALVILDIEQTLSGLGKDPRMETLPFVGSHKKDRPILGERWPDDVDQEAAAQLERLAPDLAQIDRLQAYQGGRFPLDVAENPFETLLPYLSLLRPAAKLKKGQAIHRVMHGDNSHLNEDVASILCQCRLLRDEPFLISALVRIACYSLAISTIEEACAQAVHARSILLQMDERMAALEAKNNLALAMRGERALFIDAIEYFRKGGDLGAGLGITMPKPTCIPGLRGLSLYDQALGLRMYNRIVQAADDLEEVLRVAKQQESERDTLPKYGSMFTKLLMPSFRRSFELALRLNAEIRCARVALTVERYRIDQSIFPQQLEQLIPDYLEKIPEDPFDHQPLRYHKGNDYVVVYSVGEDKKDHNGKVNHFRRENDPRDCGFVLLSPEMRGRPYTGKPLYELLGPTTAPSD